jgi:MFS family permease
MVGTLIEFYDFQIYGTAAALVFPHVFFPSLGTAAATVASIATFGVAFVARPVGSLIFGHFGDRLGRKKTLIVSLMGMGIATVGVGLTPGGAQIGVLAPLVVVVLRIVQGLSAGGELAGATLYCAEYAPAGKRGFWAALPNLGSNFAITVVNGTFLVMALWVSPAAFLSWGWRIPFLVSAVLVAVGLYVRLRVEESPVFKSQANRAGVARVPVVEAFARQRREIFLAMGMGVMAYAIAYLWLVYLVGYGVTMLGLSRVFVLVIGIFAGLVCTSAVVASGTLSDRIGRRRALLWCNVAAVVWSLLLFPIIDLRTAVSYGVAVFVSAFIGTFELGVMAAYLPELFQTRYRYTASAISLNGASLLGGGIVPLLAPVILGAFGGLALGGFLAIISAVAVLCAWALRETRGGSLEWTDVEAARRGEPQPVTES